MQTQVGLCISAVKEKIRMGKAGLFCVFRVFYAHFSDDGGAVDYLWRDQFALLSHLYI